MNKSLLLACIVNTSQLLTSSVNASSLLASVVACRFHGRYEDLNGGISSDSLVDVTGGVGRSNHIEHMDSNDREQMYHKLRRDFHWNTLVVCGKNVRVDWLKAASCVSRAYLLP